ncbi:hypothetical protein [Actinoplanes siamensis]|uniref:hypothetical protein n=1 Tax=Actinoplanes siamensis TaxID=1223317 RepID=UPI00194109C4|nr:hypothetical protein [Actinoplanes siamensis]
MLANADDTVVSPQSAVAWAADLGGLRVAPYSYRGHVSLGRALPLLGGHSPCGSFLTTIAKR